MEHLSQAQQQLIRERFQVADLRTQVHLTYWSELHFITQELLDLLPFGRVLGATAFYRFVDFQFEGLISAVQTNLTLWALIGVRQFRGDLVNQLALFFDSTFFWQYCVPPVWEEILRHLQEGNRIRFLSRVYLSQTKVELEFNEIQALSISDTEFQLVYMDSKEYTCDLHTRIWDITVHNLDNNLIDPGIYTRTPQFLGTSREAECQAYYERIRNDSNLILTADYWASIDSTEVPSLTSRASTPLSEYQRSRDLDQCASPAKISRYCYCGIDVWMLRSGSLKVRLAQDNCVGEFKGKGSGRVFGNDQR